MPGRRPVVAALGAAAFLLSCHTITEDQPEPAPLPHAPSSETHAPPAAPPPAARSCTLPRGTGSGNNCPRESPSFLREVEEAMDQVARESPQLFDLGRRRGCDNCYLVVDPDHFTARMVEVLEQRGFCATY